MTKRDGLISLFEAEERCGKTFQLSEMLGFGGFHHDYRLHIYNKTGTIDGWICLDKSDMINLRKALEHIDAQ